MDTPQRKKEKSLIIGLVGLIIVIIILAMIGFFMLKPGDKPYKDKQKRPKYGYRENFRDVLSNLWWRTDKAYIKAILLSASFHPMPKLNSCRLLLWRMYIRPKTKK